MKSMFTVHRSPLSMRYPFTVIHEAQRLRVNGKCMVNSKWPMVNNSANGNWQLAIGTGGAE